jgi:SsrA-binding protein
MAPKKQNVDGTVVARNRKARHTFAIDQTFEAGIALFGTEVKSLREGRATITEAYAGDSGGELFLFNAYIPEYRAASHFSHNPRRQRKLLMHKREVAKLLGAVNREGMTLVPLAVYFNSRGIAKVQLALARGKRKADKRAAIKDRDWQRRKARLMRGKG